MIHIKRDKGLIPQDILDAAEAATKTLESLPEDKRNEYIKKNGDIWRAFNSYFSKMSHGKCWYSESPESHSPLDVDHYRPKNEAKRSENEIDPGYEWLAFTWENFRLSAIRSNRLFTNTETEEVDGKGSWFPLLKFSPKATWANRCEDKEKPVLLDPVVEHDVELIDVTPDGRIIPHRLVVGSERKRVNDSCKLYGLNLPKIKDARFGLIREIIKLIESLTDTADLANETMPDETADRLPIPKLKEVISMKASDSSPYARTVRTVLAREGLSDLIP